MPKFVLKGPIEAVQWNKDGDHPQVHLVTGPSLCGTCSVPWSSHGWCGDQEDIICPGSWLFESVSGDLQVLDDYAFRRTYREVEGD